MAVKEQRWVVRDARGRIYGPFSTSKVLFYIERGNFNGQEAIAKHPGGAWGLMSKVPEFCDALLTALIPDNIKAPPPDNAPSEFKNSASGDNESQGEVGRAIPEQANKFKFINNDDEEEGDKAADLQLKKESAPTAPSPGSASHDETEEDLQVGSRASSKKEPVSPELLNVQDVNEHFELKVKKVRSQEASTPAQDDDSPNDSYIELRNVESYLKSKRLKALRWPGAIGAAAVIGALALIFMLPDSKSFGPGGKVKLLVPRRNQPSIDIDEVKQRYAKAAAGFASDSFEGLIFAQNELVKILEGSPKLSDGYALLCLTQKELWPYTAQKSQDLAAARSVAQAGYQTDVLGFNGAVCKTTDLMLSNRYTEAISAVDGVLETYPSATVLYQLRAELFGAQRKYETAADYSHKAIQLWPGWLKPYFTRAMFLMELDRFGESDQLLRKILLENPTHQAAKVELAIIQIKHFRNYDRAFDYLFSAVNSKQYMSPNTEAKAYWALAKVYFERNETSKALSAAERCFKLSGSNVECKNLVVQLGGSDSLKTIKQDNHEALFLGDQYAKSGDCFAAQAEYKAAFELDNKNGLAAMKAARCLWQLSYTTEAIEWLEKAIHADPQLTEAYATLADYRAQRFDYEAAYRVLGQVIKRFPKDYRVYQGYGVVEFRRRNYKAAIAYLERARKLYTGDVETYVLLAQSYLGLQAYPEAFEQASKALEMDFNHVGALTTYAKTLGAAKSYVDGINFLQERINTYPSIVEFRVAQAELYNQDEKLPEARNIYRAIVENGVENKKVFIQLGDLELTLSNPDDALRYYLRAAAIDATDAEPFFKAAVLYHGAKKLFSARSHFEKALQANPRYPSAHYYLGRIALEYNNIQLALEESTKERRMNPNLADAYLLAAEAYSRNSQYRECAGEYQKAIKLRPQGSDIYVRIAKCYRLSGNLEVALSMLKVAAGQESGNPDIYKEQGAIYQMKGDLPAAVEAYDKYLSLAPNAPDRALIERAKASTTPPSL